MFTATTLVHASWIRAIGFLTSILDHSVVQSPLEAATVVLFFTWLNQIMTLKTKSTMACKIWLFCLSLQLYLDLSLSSGHSSLAVLKTNQTSSHRRTFAFAVSSTWIQSKAGPFPSLGPQLRYHLLEESFYNYPFKCCPQHIAVSFHSTI